MKRAILTIDDGPSPDRQIILEVLAQKGIRAVFFSEGKKLEAQSQLGLETIRAGHILANHSFSHPHFSEISLEQAREEIECTGLIISDLYRKSGVEQAHKLFRFPYGDKGDGRNGFVFKWWLALNRNRHQAIQEMLKTLGYRHLPTDQNLPAWYAPLSHDLDTHWTFDVMEWSLTQPKPIWNLSTIEAVQKRLHLRQPRDIRGLPFWQKRWLGNEDVTEIILMHDQAGLGQYFAQILDQLQTHIQFIDP
jgi:peptidoglycan-N-acetylglucosamine deacetylase